MAKARYPGRNIATIDNVCEVIFRTHGNCGGGKRVTGATDLIADLGFDSLNMVEVVMDLEDEYEVPISDSEMDHIKTAQQAFDIILRKQAAK